MRNKNKGNKIIIDGDVSRVYLSNGEALTIDTEDVSRVSKYTWWYGKTGAKTRPIGEPDNTILLSRFILFGDNHKTDERCADHINHNIFDNRKLNLRPATNQQNLLNQLPRKNGTSKFKGVYWHKYSKKWLASIRCNNLRYYLGVYINEIEAAQEYDRAAKKIHGEFAYLNFK